ncbi:uncharacterized protein LOC125217738 [Salvia hispanica]|uniref:uncharacterized protein LOC125217738 n=1 Tax=Salvia hispanica TaxID=49212 RepID=UPI0020096BCB|nr:uncharacterized protein LOC125217738 [Salvia hispanica]
MFIPFFFLTRPVRREFGAQIDDEFVLHIEKLQEFKDKLQKNIEVLSRDNFTAGLDIDLAGLDIDLDESSPRDDNCLPFHQMSSTRNSRIRLLIRVLTVDLKLSLT